MVILGSRSPKQRTQVPRPPPPRLIPRDAMPGAYPPRSALHVLAERAAFLEGPNTPGRSQNPRLRARVG